jgi:hypothetical protein
MHTVGALDHPDRLSAQHRGEARMFRTRVGQALLTAGPAMKALVDRTDREFKKRNGNLPKDFLPNLEDQWRALPDAARLSLEITRTRRTCTIVDTRLIPETLGNGDWGDGGTEPALIVVQNIYEITRHWTRTSSVTTSAIGLHALGRFKGRAADPADDALMDDIAALAATAVTMLTDPTPREVSIPVGSGFWLGRVADFRDIHQSNRAALAIRTYVVKLTA